MSSKAFIIFLSCAASCLSQRSPYAGRNPIGFPAIETETTSANIIGNRFGDGNSTTTTSTESLPVEARGDRDLVNRMSKLPMDQQPFWLLNWKALEENRKNPQTYQQKENTFIDRASNVKNPNESPNQMPQNSAFDNSNRQEVLEHGKTDSDQQNVQDTVRLGPEDIDVSNNQKVIGNPQEISRDDGLQNMNNMGFQPQNNQGSGLQFTENRRRFPNSMQNVGNQRFVPQNIQGMQRPVFEFGNNRRPFRFNPQNSERGFNTQFNPQTNMGSQNNGFMPQSNGMNNFRPQGFRRMPNEWIPNQRFPTANIGGERRPSNSRPGNYMNNYDREFESQSMNRRPSFPYEDFKKEE